MAELNATCAICGKKYHMCNSCGETKIKPWLSIVDTVNHYKIYLTIRDYVNGYTTKEDAQKDLAECDLSGMDTFEPNIQNVLNDILPNKSKSTIDSENITTEKSVTE